MNIEIISGSPRKGSITKRVALNLNHQLNKNTTHKIGFIAMDEIELPFIQKVWSNLEMVPEEFKSIAQQIFHADAFILVTPEYNGAYSSALKNLFDHFPKQFRKTIGIVTASPGALGGIRASQELLLLSSALFAFASPSLLIVPGVDKKFDETGNLIEEGFQKNIDQFISDFLWLAEKIKPLEQV